MKPLRSVKQPLRHSLVSFFHRIDSRPWCPRLAYLPMILSSVHILDLLQQGKVFCMPCPKSHSTARSKLTQPEQPEIHVPHTTDPEHLTQSTDGSSICPSTKPIFGIHPTVSNSSRDHCSQDNDASFHSCPVCKTSVVLRLSPAIIGDLFDETGSLTSVFQLSSSSAQGQHMSASNSPSKDHPRRCLHHMPPILWTDTAYMSLFGMTPEEMGRLCLRAISAVSQVKQVSTSQGGGPISEHRQRGTEELDLLRYLERRVAWMRIVLLVG